MNRKTKKILILIILILLIIDIPFILYLFNLNNVAFDENFYKKEFRKYNVYEKLDDYDVDKINNEVLSYLRYNNKQELIENNFFNQREKDHLLDVKNTIQKTIKFYYFSIFLFFSLLILLIFLLNNNIMIIKQLGWVFFIAGILTLLDAFIFYLIINANFLSFFDTFHNFFFEKGTFSFDPSFENIVNLYPESLFFDMTYRIVINTLIFSLLLTLVGILFLVLIKFKLRKIKKQKNI